MASAKRKIGTVGRSKSSPNRQHIELGNAVLKRAGGSLVMTVPASARDALHLSEGTKMTVTLAGRQLVLEPVRDERPKYTLEELLAQCDPEASSTEEERAWLDAPPAGRELL